MSRLAIVVTAVSMCIVLAVRPAPAVVAQEEASIIGLTHPPAAQGTVSVPELGRSARIVDGHFEFRNIQLSRDYMLISFEIIAEGYRPATWANYVILYRGATINFTPPLHEGTEPERIDPCPSLLANPQDQSAAEQLHAALCAELPSAGAGPSVGGTRASHLPPIVALVFLGLTLFAGGARLANRR